MILNFTVIPVFRRDLVAAARQREGRRLHWERSSFAGMLAAIVLGTFGARFYWSDGYVTHPDDDRAPWNVKRRAGGVSPLRDLLLQSWFEARAWSITKERDRRYLEVPARGPQ